MNYTFRIKGSKGDDIAVYYDEDVPIDDQYTIQKHLATLKRRYTNIYQLTNIQGKHMSYFSRQLNRSIKSLQDGKHCWLADKLEDLDIFIHQNRVTSFLREVKRFAKTLPFFMRLAWGWRAWDFTFTIEVLVELLKAQGRYCKDGHLQNGRKIYKRAMTAAGYLERAYLKPYDDATIKYLYNKNPIRIVEHRMQRDQVTDEHTLKAMSMLAEHREDRIQQEDKDKAWDYLKKYIEHFWD